MAIGSIAKIGMTNRRNFLAGAMAVPFASALPVQPTALAQTQWPSRNITVIVPFAPGGMADLAARPVAQALHKILGRPVVVDNRGGAGGALGAATVAKSEPDGHTMLLTLNSIIIAPEAARILNVPPLYELEQLEPVAQVLSEPNILVVHTSSSWKTVKDLADDAKKRPAEITYGSSGNYGPSHLATETFTNATGIKLQHVPYRGVGPAITALIAKQIGVLSTTAGTVNSHVEAGTLRVLGSMSAERIRSLPNVPTLREAGYPVESQVWAGLFVPKGVPEPIVRQIRSAMQEVMRDPAVTAVFEKASAQPAYLDAPEFARLVERDRSLVGAVIKTIGKVE
jgi:tripartite-type tricarboxylate transporter receptor subunit TctC